MTAIETKYLAPTDYRGPRVVASANGNKPSHRAMIEWDGDITDDQNHANAALALARKLEWQGELIIGHFTRGRVFVLSNGGRFAI